ncbi:MAG: DUF503 domain-containing protein [Bacteroidales bacterium]|nr:DUF503 domain-containing protein [Bacteroidales bacterium]
MLIGLCKVYLFLPNSHSLKDKRGIMRSYINLLRKKYNISVSEIDQKNIWKNSTVGIASISDDRKVIDRIMAKIILDT